MVENIKVVLDHVDTVEENKDGDHEADGEAEEDVAVIPALDSGVEKEIVGGRGQEGHHQEDVGHQPGDQEETLGEEEAQEEEEVGDQADGVGGEGGLVEDVSGHHWEAWTEVMAVEAQDGDEGHGDSDAVDGDSDDTVWSGEAAARHEEDGRAGLHLNTVLGEVREDVVVSTEQPKTVSTCLGPLTLPTPQGQIMN